MELQLSEGSLTTFQVLTLPFNCAWWVHLIWSGNLVVDCPGKRGGGGKVSRLNQVNLTRYSPGLVHWQLKGREINPWCPKVSFDFLCINKKERKQDDMATCDHWSTMVWSYLLGVDVKSWGSTLMLLLHLEYTTYFIVCYRRVVHFLFRLTCV